MNNLQNFEGDLLLEDTPDGGDIQLINDVFVSDTTLKTAVYLSLFGGNKDDNGKVKNKNTWWGNTLAGVSENEKIISRFQSIIFSLPMSTKNIQEAETAAKLDLQWIIDEGIGNDIIVSGSAIARNKFKIKINISVKEKNIYENSFSTPWQVGGV
jgi:phage gp46-like protein